MCKRLNFSPLYVLLFISSLSYTYSSNLDSLWRQRFKQASLEYPPKSIVIEVFKYPRVIHIYAFNQNKNRYDSVWSYPICIISGNFGPKRKQGDLQVPEGFYHINVFNPHSRFKKSLGINYPNASDRILGVKNNLGGNIFIHGSCASIGCISIYDDQIYELYFLASLVHNTQDKIPVLIFPWTMTDWAITNISKNLPANDKWLIDFWLNLKIIYDAWTSTKKIPLVRVDRNGKYCVLR